MKVQSDCLPDSMYDDSDEVPWLEELIDSPVGKIRKIKTLLETQDILGTIRVRLGIKRDNYRVSPGLYAVGSPDSDSHVLVTANYKLTFDSLRSKLAGQNLWILVLDTKGINVWCAAGKGTFGTEELIQRISLVQLPKAVSHNKLILPQLGAPGVSAHEVTKHTGFKVVYGPIKAIHIPQFLSDNLKATEEMRKVEFGLIDRLAVIPVELNYSLKFIPVLFVLFVLFNLINPGGIRLTEAFLSSFFNLIPYLVSIALGTIGIAVLLPYLPFRSFALKGLLLGLIWAAIAVKYNSAFHFPAHNLILTANGLLLTSISTFLALNFTGSTTYTSLSGVKIETLYTIPVVILASVTGLVLVITYKVLLFIG